MILSNGSIVHCNLLLESEFPLVGFNGKGDAFKRIVIGQCGKP